MTPCAGTLHDSRLPHTGHSGVMLRCGVVWRQQSWRYSNSWPEWYEPTLGK